MAGSAPARCRTGTPSAVSTGAPSAASLAHPTAGLTAPPRRSQAGRPPSSRPYTLNFWRRRRGKGGGGQRTVWGGRGGRGWSSVTIPGKCEWPSADSCDLTQSTSHSKGAPPHLALVGEGLVVHLLALAHVDEGLGGVSEGGGRWVSRSVSHQSSVRHQSVTSRRPRRWGPWRGGGGGRPGTPPSAIYQPRVSRQSSASQSSVSQPAGSQQPPPVVSLSSARHLELLARRLPCTSRHSSALQPVSRRSPVTSQPVTVSHVTLNCLPADSTPLSDAPDVVHSSHRSPCGREGGGGGGSCAAREAAYTTQIFKRAAGHERGGARCRRAR